jgi:hypothetical protein
VELKILASNFVSTVFFPENLFCHFFKKNKQIYVSLVKLFYETEVKKLL